ncbi:HAD-IIA family hydrolase [Haloferula rosea]|uniref:HAD family hydrolase n=1 Tax=Haloferula rosea TaxID=490093 RepID=A0A934RFH2_9BACT|nr:HAD-IIA family hydrolase [Haloferula rosea]MBK1828658.1 HAD family hydrolase [Haloferula rosea]
MKKTGFLLDMDGVIYRGNQLVPGADHFIARLREEGHPFLFLTNNSQRTRRDVALKLSRLGIPATDSDVFTCAMATARFLATQRPGGTAFVVGENGLANALHKNGFTVADDEVDFVVVGEGRVINFEMLEHAARLVEQGARLIATNMDTRCPTESGVRPGCGAIVAMIEKATGRQAFSVGKPSPVMMREARKELDLRTEEVVMIGDTMYTDVLGGVQMGYKTVLVLSGHTSREEISDYAYRPDYVAESVAHLPEALFGNPAPLRIPA